MKWNAIITRRQYENAMLREAELSHDVSAHEDERKLLRLLIKDYEDRNSTGRASTTDIFSNNSAQDRRLCW